jgi:CheY-like chemotaxis protein
MAIDIVLLAAIAVAITILVVASQRREPAITLARRPELGPPRPVGEVPPAGPPARAERETQLAERYRVQRLRILVVDDNAVVGDTISRLLEAHEVTTAASAEAALSALAYDPGFDAILYALMMPGMPGVAFAAAIADRHPALRPRMAFLINGSSTPETFRLLALSNVPWVTKPIRYAQLATCISEIAAQPASAA